MKKRLACLLLSLLLAAALLPSFTLAEDGEKTDFPLTNEEQFGAYVHMLFYGETDAATREAIQSLPGASDHLAPADYALEQALKTEIIKISPEYPESDKLNYCGAVIRYGGLVAFPTETVYGLGGSAYNSKAAANIFAAKGRPGDNPLIVHVSDYRMAEGAGSFSDNAQRELFYRLGKAYWPGPLTMIVNKTSRVPNEVSGGLATVGLRMPSNRIAAGLIRAAGVLMMKPEPPWIEMAS